MKITNDNITITDNHAEIAIEYQNKIHIVLIDIDDVKYVINRSLFIYSTGYCYVYNTITYKAAYNIKEKYSALHSIILNHNPNIDKRICDHNNLNKLDNRRSNIKLVTRTYNRINTNQKGYSYEKSSGKWRVYITFNNKKIVKRVNTEIEAITERKRMIELYYPKMNIVKTNSI